MGKDFFEVFPTLNLSEETKFLLKDVRVTKVSTNSTRDFIRIYLFSTHLLQKKKIYELEYAIKHQLFDRTMIQVEILESYQLSEQYTPENLMHEYYDSILLELEQRSAVERSMFEHADYDFEDSVLNLKLQNSIVAEGKKEAIVSLLSEVFICLFPLKSAINRRKKRARLSLTNFSFRQKWMKLLRETRHSARRNGKIRKRRMPEKTGQKKRKQNLLQRH